MVLVSPPFFGCQQSGSTVEPVENATSTARVVIPVEGMSCLSCVATVKKTLSGMNGVTEVNVSLENKMATVSFDATQVTYAELQEGINKLGYRAGEPQAYTEPR